MVWVVMREEGAKEEGKGGRGAAAEREGWDGEEMWDEWVEVYPLDLWLWCSLHQHQPQSQVEPPREAKNVTSQTTHCRTSPHPKHHRAALPPTHPIPRAATAGKHQPHCRNAQPHAEIRPKQKHRAANHAAGQTPTRKIHHDPHNPHNPERRNQHRSPQLNLTQSPRRQSRRQSNPNAKQTPRPPQPRTPQPAPITPAEPHPITTRLRSQHHASPTHTVITQHHAVTALTSHDSPNKNLKTRRCPNFNPRTQPPNAAPQTNGGQSSWRRNRTRSVVKGNRFAQMEP
ncbi:hypothetical protein Drorol1_Dr00017934 [Drosera rotundifolia]